MLAQILHSVLGIVKSPFFTTCALPLRRCDSHAQLLALLCCSLMPTYCAGVIELPATSNAAHRHRAC